MKTEVKNEAWPHWSYKTKREWKKDVRKRWIAYRKAIMDLRDGSAFYPAKLDLHEFNEQDKII